MRFNAALERLIEAPSRLPLHFDGYLPDLRAATSGGHKLRLNGVQQK
jgi:hypothetical protein